PPDPVAGTSRLGWEGSTEVGEVPSAFHPRPLRLRCMKPDRVAASRADAHERLRDGPGRMEWLSRAWWLTVKGRSPRADVLVHAEQVLGIVLRLQPRESQVVLPVRHTDPDCALLLFVLHVVDVHAPAQGRT